MRPPAEQLRIVKQYGTLTLVGKEWVFRGDPTKRCPVEVMTHESKWHLIETIYMLTRDKHIF